MTPVDFVPPHGISRWICFALGFPLVEMGGPAEHVLVPNCTIVVMQGKKYAFCRNSSPNGYFGTPFSFLSFLVAELLSTQIVCSDLF